MVISFLLLHSPLLGPTSWRPCGEVLAAAGHQVAIPDLRWCLTPVERWWDRVVSQAAVALGMAGPPDRIVVAGHSGAGIVLPLVAQGVTASAVVFVDAVIPAASGATRTDGGLREKVAALADDDGLLPPWSSWWPPSTMAELVPDDALRQALEAEQLRLPETFYDVEVPVPDGWEQADVSYVQLSPAYDVVAAEAVDRGWRVDAIPGLHLDIVRRPAEVAAALCGVIE
ncbi:alpha/beta hydrolase [Phytoactinopolyspora limicola]|uniref:alpha/beta hydrolase n=1 Tax=Phytoactinopolyspora limicola TaxID=2715536 RepID=UPI001407D746|nr:alpha/beta hydrolase [Phytoactinopolyspora limicola]